MLEHAFRAVNRTDFSMATGSSILASAYPIVNLKALRGRKKEKRRGDKKKERKKKRRFPMSHTLMICFTLCNSSNIK